MYYISQRLKYFILTLFIFLLFYPTNVFSASLQNQRPLLLVSQHGSVLIAIHENKSTDLATIIAKMEYDIHALEVVFQQMLNDGKLDTNHRTLVINTGFNGSARDGFLNMPARIYRTNRVMLYGGWIRGLLKSDTIIGEARNLGKAYVIDTSADFLTLNDLLAFIHVLPEVDDASVVKEIRNEKELLAAKKQIPANLIERTTFDILSLYTGVTDMFNFVGRGFFTTTWHNGVVTHYLQTTTGEERVPLPVLPHYLLKPVWGNARQGEERATRTRLLAYGSSEELIIKDILVGTIDRINLQALRPADSYAIDNINLYSNTLGDEICIVLSVNGHEPVGYIWRIGTGLLGQTTVPTELNPAGWLLMHRGTEGFLFRDINLVTGQDAEEKYQEISLAISVQSTLNIILWIGAMVVCFGLPYLLAHLIALKLALWRSKTSKIHIFIPALSGVLFVLLSVFIISTIAIIDPFNIEHTMLPLPWGNPGDMKAHLDMLISFIIYVPVMIILAVLNSLQTKVFLRRWKGNNR